MGRAMFIPALLLLCACPTTRDKWDQMTPEERAAEIEYQAERVKLYVEVLKPIADAEIAQGNWKREDVDMALGAASSALDLLVEYHAQGTDPTPAQQRALALKLEAAALKFIALGIQRIVEADEAKKAAEKPAEPTPE